jgi:hypothetical protein
MPEANKEIIKVGKTPMHHTTFHKAKAVAKLLQKYDRSRVLT